MKANSTRLKRILAVLLILATMCAVFASCAVGNEKESGSDIESGELGGQDAIGGADGELDENSAQDIPIFSNGAYTAKIIRGEMASTFEKDIYNKIRELFKSRTGVNPTFDTDFVAAGAEKYEGPAILIGETDYAESKTAYKKLGNGQATATVIGNKYVIAVSSADAAEKLITSLKTNLNKKATKEEITIKADWKISVKIDFVSSGNVSSTSISLL